MADNNLPSGNDGKALKAGVWYTFCFFLTKGIAFISVPLFTRLLSSEEFGNYSSFVAWLGIVSIVTTMDMFATVNRARYDYDNLEGYLASVVLAGSVMTTLCWGIVNLFPTFFENLFSMERIYINIMFASVMVSPALSLFQAKNRIRYRYKTYTAIVLTSVVLSTLVSLILVILMQDKLLGRILGQYGTLFLVDSAIYIYILVKGKRIKFSECKYAIIICLPLIPHLLSKFVLNQSDRIMIKYFCGPTDTALYSLAYHCAMIPIVLATAMNTAWSPWLSEKIHANDYPSVQKASFYYVSFFNSMVIGLMLLAPELLLIFGGSRYIEAKWVLPPVVLGAVFQFLFNLYVSVEQFAKKTVGMAAGTCLAAVINVLLNWLFIPRYGYIAAAYTTVAGYLILLIIHYYLTVKIGYKEVYNNKFVFVSSSVMLIIMFVIMPLYNFSVLRYGIISAYVIIMGYMFYINKNRLMRLLRNR